MIHNRNIVADDLFILLLILLFIYDVENGEEIKDLN